MKGVRVRQMGAALAIIGKEGIRHAAVCMLLSVHFKSQ